MASGSNYLTTYYAKRIIGDTAAANASSALLQTGTSIATHTWILNRTDRASTYGIKYFYDTSTREEDQDGETVTINNEHDKIELYGGQQENNADVPSAWIQLDTGDLYVLGNVGIGHEPDTYKLYINGTGFFSGFLTVSVNGESGIQICDGKHYDDNTFRVVLDLNPDSGNHGIYSSGYSNGTTFTSDGKWLLIRSSDGSVQMNGNALSATQVYVTNTGLPSSDSVSYYINFSDSTTSGNQDIRNTAMLYLWRNTTDNYLNVGNASATGAITLWKSGYNYNIVPTVLTAMQSATLPNTSGWIAMGGNGSSTGVGGQYAPVYLSAAGVLTEITAGTSAQFYRGDKTWSNTLTGNLTLTDGGIFRIDHTGQGAKTKGTAYGAFYITFKNSANNTTYAVTPIRYVGTDGTDSYNTCVILGSDNGTTWIGAGESSNYLPDKIAYNDENLYLSADGSVKIYTNGANDGSSYSGPVTISGTTITANLTGNVTGNCSGSSGSCTGNAATATTLQTSRTIWGQSFNGSANITGQLSITNADIIVSDSGTTTRQLRFQVGTNDYGRIGAGATAANAGWIEIASADDGNEPIYARQYTGAFTTVKRTLTLLDASGNSSFPGTVTASGFTGNVTGNCSGTAGGVAWANVSSKPAQATRWPAWSEVTDKPSTFSPSSHTHSYLALTGGTLTGLLKITTNNNTVTIGSANTNWCHFSNSADIPFYFNKQVTVDGALLPYTTNTRALGDSTHEWATSAVRIMYARHYDSSIGYSDDQNLYFGYNRGLNHYFYTCNNGSNRAQRAYIDTQGVHNAVWNDFAEYRKSSCKDPGRVVVDDGDGCLNLCNERLAGGARIISDTYGCSVGYSLEQDTPIGVGGRVLVYPYQPIKNYHVGDCVCACLNGTVDIMTREEIIQFPDRIIGIVSEIPNYEIWSQQATKDSTPNELKVNGRIWVYVK